MAKRGHRGGGGEEGEMDGFGRGTKKSRREGGREDRIDQRSERKERPERRESAEEEAAKTAPPPETTWRPFAGAQVLESLKGKLPDMEPTAPPSPSREGKKVEQVALEGEKPAEGKRQAAVAETKPEVTPPPKEKPKKQLKEKKPRQPRKKKEVALENKEEREKRESKEGIEAIYNDLKKSGKTYGDVLTYMEEHREAFSKLARFEAAETLLEDINRGEITPEIIEKFKEGRFDTRVAFGHEHELKKPMLPRGKGPKEGVYSKTKEAEVILNFIDALEAGSPHIGAVRDLEVYQEDASLWHWDEWYNFLLGAYTVDPGMKKNIEDYLKKHAEERKKFSKEAYLAHERLFDELLAEKEGRELGEKFREREEAKPKLSERDIDELTLGFREYLQNLPVPEGKTILERLRQVQAGEFESMLGENISWEDIDNKTIEKKAAEIKEKLKISPEEAKTRAEELVRARAAARAEVASARERIEGLRIIRKKPGAKEEEIKIKGGEEETDYKRKKEELDVLDAELKEAGEAAENELITEAAKKFFALQELVVHHNGGWDPKRGFRNGYYSDLDGRSAVAIWRMAGIDVKKGSYVPPGYRRQGAFNIDTGLADGLFADREEIDTETGKKVVQTWYEDHHGMHSDRATSATKNLFEDFVKSGLLKFESEEDRRAMEKAVELVTQDDNYTFPGVRGGELYQINSGYDSGKKIYETSDRRFIGYIHGMSFDRILQFFTDQEKKPAHLRKTPADELTDGELKRYGLYEEKVAKRRERIKRDVETVEKLIKDGWVVTTRGGKKLVIDIGDKMGREGQWAAGSRGLDGILRYNPEDHSFTVALNEGIFDESTQEILSSLPQGILIRNNFFYKPAAEKVKLGPEEEMSERTKEMLERVKGELLVTLGELTESIADPKKENEFGKDLKEFLEKEKREGKLIKTNIFKIEEREIKSESVVTGKDIKDIRANWWARTSDGMPVLVEKAPKDFSSGGEGLIRLKEKAKAILRGENIEKFGLEWSGDGKEEKEVDFWFGEWEKTKFPEPTPEEREREEAKRKVAEFIGEEIEDRRKKLYRDPSFSDVPIRVIEGYLEKIGEELWQRLVKTS